MNYLNIYQIFILFTINFLIICSCQERIFGDMRSDWKACYEKQFLVAINQNDSELQKLNFMWSNDESKESIRQNQAKNMKRYIDNSIDPCQDFFQFSCGNWNKYHQIPKDKTGFDTFEILRENLDEVLRDLLENYDDENEMESLCSTKKPSGEHLNIEELLDELNLKILEKQSHLEKLLMRSKLNTNKLRLKRNIFERSKSNLEVNAIKKAKLFYESCNNIEIIKKNGIQPLLDLLDTFGGWPVLNKNWKCNHFDWLNQTAFLRLYNNDVFMIEWVGPDIKNSTKNVIQLDQTNFGLPTRDYYLQKSNQKYLLAYKEFMTSIMIIMDVEHSFAVQTGEEILNFEINLANITKSPEERVNISEYYNFITLRELHNAIPEINFKKYLSIIQNREVELSERIVVYAMDYMKKLVKLLEKTEKKTVSNYLMWRLVRHRINNLDERFDECKRKFFYILLGREENPPRWKTCINQVNTNMGMAVGAIFVKNYFNEKSKSDTLEIAQNIQKAFRQMLCKNTWIDECTKRLANLKLDTMSLKIGYPDFILSSKDLNKKYQGLDIYANKYFENTLNTLKYINMIEQTHIFEEVDRTTWETAPAIVNAYYSRNKNQIMFPAGILQPPFYHKYFPKSLNYGGIGAVIGHELTHAFDDKGRLFDYKGNVKKWWSDITIKQFRDRVQCLISQYSNYTVSDVNLKVDGENTQGENIADNGGLKQAFLAYKNWLHENQEKICDEQLPDLNMTNKQLFFLNFAQVWCGQMRPEATKNKLKNALHSPGKFRVIGTLSNLVEFSEEFKCKEGSPMNPKRKCNIW